MLGVSGITNSTHQLTRLLSDSTHQFFFLFSLNSVCSSNVWGQLGLGDLTSRGGTAGTIGDNLPFVDLASHVILEIQAYNGCTCIRVSVPAGTPDVYCWGQGDVLGQESSATIGDNPGEMGVNLRPTNLLNAARGITSTKKLSEAPGAQTICAEMNTGDFRCWGWTSHGGTGHSTGGSQYYGNTAGSMGANMPETRIY